MYNAATIKEALIGLVGWKQNNDPLGWQLTDLTTSSSGLWYNGIHPLLTFDDLASVCPQFDLVDDDTAAVNTAFTNWVKEKTEDSIIKAVEAWISDKFNFGTANNLLDQKNLFSSSGNITDIESSSGDFVGIEARPIRQKSILTTIQAFSLQLTENQTLKVSLFKSGTIEPIKSTSAVYDADGGVQWFDVDDWTLKGEGTYWIGYHQDSLVGDAINGVRDYSAISAGSTNFPSGRYVRTTAFRVDSDGSELWNLEDNRYTVSTNYGLNIKYDVRCDYTDFIVAQKNLFKSLIAYQVGMDFLRELAYNPNSRVNRNLANISKSELLYSIDGDSQGRDGFSVHGGYKKALGNLQFDTTGIEKICLPCRKRGIRMQRRTPNHSGGWLG